MPCHFVPVCKDPSDILSGIVKAVCMLRNTSNGPLLPLRTEVIFHFFCRFFVCSDLVRRLLGGASIYISVLLLLLHRRDVYYRHLRDFRFWCVLLSSEERHALRSFEVSWCTVLCRPIRVGWRIIPGTHWMCWMSRGVCVRSFYRLTPGNSKCPCRFFILPRGIDASAVCGHKTTR